MVRSEPMDSPAIKLAGYSMLVLMAPTLLTLWHVPEVRGAIPAGRAARPSGLCGTAGGIQYGGSESRRSLAIFFAALFWTTRFSFIETHEWLRGPLSKLNVIGPLRERYWAWREDREQERMRKRLEQIKMQGRPPIPSYAAANVDVNAAAEDGEGTGGGVRTVAQRLCFEVLRRRKLPRGLLSSAAHRPRARPASDCLLPT